MMLSVLGVGNLPSFGDFGLRNLQELPAHSRAHMEGRVVALYHLRRPSTPHCDPITALDRGSVLCYSAAESRLLQRNTVGVRCRQMYLVARVVMA